MARDYSQMAKDIMKNVGGEENVISLAHCITRLRFKLKDESLVDDKALNAIPGVIQVLHVPGQTHVVVGQIVDLVYDEIRMRSGIRYVGEVDAGAHNDATDSVMAVIIDLISGILSPTLGAMSAAGIIKGIMSLWLFVDPTCTTLGAYRVLNAIGDGFYYFLPVILGYAAAKKFDLDVFVGMTLGAALVYPDMTAMGAEEMIGSLFGGSFFEMHYASTFFGIPIILPPAGYTSSVVPVVLACFVASKVEAVVRPRLPNYIRFFMAPCLTLLVVGPIMYLVLGPISTLACSAIQWVFNTVASVPVVGGALFGALVAGLWQILVIFGFHWALIPLAITNIGTLGYDFVLPPTWVCSFAQTAVVAAIYLRTRSQALKDSCLPAILTGLFGVTEPCIYGVTLPRIRYFVVSCVASMFGGALVAFMGCRSYRMGGLSFFGLPNKIDPTPVAEGGQGLHSVIWMLVGAAIAIVIAFAVTWLMYQDLGKDLEDAGPAPDVA